MYRLLTTAVVLAGLATGCRTPPLPAYHPSLENGQEHFTKVSLRTADGVFLRSSNVLSLRQMIPIGSRAEVTRFSEGQVDMVINKVHHTMFPAGGSFDTSETGIERFLDKYFASSPEKADPEKLGPPELVASIRRGHVLKGMTKPQVYAALGPPQWIGEVAEPSVRLSRTRILRSNRWIYTDSFIGGMVPQKVAYLFEGDRLQEVAD